MAGEEKSTEKKQLAWSQEIPNYGDKLLKRLDEFRKTTILYDVRVLANNGDFNAHKVILAACGGIFRSCFIDEKNKMLSSTITELKLDCPAQGLKPIIRFAYTGALVVTKRNAVATMIAADVTKMKEVQEICADIAIKEYSWIVRYTGDKKTDMTEAIQKVLSLHAPCFNHSTGNITSSDETNDGSKLPFLEEVVNVFPEYITTYQMLSAHLNRAIALLANSKSTIDGMENDKKIISTTNELKVVSDTSPPSNKKITPMATDTNKSNKTALPSPSENGISGDSDYEKSNQAESNSNIDIRSSPPLTKPRPSMAEPNDIRSSPPLTKPRSSIKSKKAAPPPPSSPQSKQASIPKASTSQPPPRPQKLPAKVPPPRPKPPAKKKTSSDEDISTKANEETEYDDNLNPFA